MTVDSNTAIKAFVESNGIEFKTGRGFYELSKAETVQQYKEVIIQDRETGEMFTGTQVREELGLSPQSEKGGVKEIDLAKKLGPFTLGGDENNPKILSLTLPAGGEDNINPKLLIDAYIGITGGKRDFYKINRTSLLTAELNKFE